MLNIIKTSIKIIDKMFGNDKPINKENIIHEKIWSKDNMTMDERLDCLHESVENLKDYVNIHFNGRF